jgi:serine/threonine-protein kinase RsbW
MSFAGLFPLQSCGMTTSPSIRTVERSLPSSLAGGYIDFIQQVLEELAELGWQRHDLFGVQMALEETISNGIRHGNKEDPDKQVHVQCHLGPHRFWAQIRDEGEGFLPGAVPDCRCAENLEAPGGRGLALICGFMTKVSYNECGNCITLEKRLDPGGSNPHDGGSASPSPK